MIETTPERLRDLRQDEISALSIKASFSAVIEHHPHSPHAAGRQVIEQMSPRQALEIYLRKQDTPPERVEVLLRH